MIKKRLIQSVSVLMVLLITITIIPLSSFSAETTYHLNFYTIYDSNGKQIKSTKQIGKLHSNLAEDMFKINGKRAYCIELDTPCNSSDSYVTNTTSSSSVWYKLGKEKRDLIKMIMCFGLEGTNKGSATTKTINGHKIDFYTCLLYTSPSPRDS